MNYTLSLRSMVTSSSSDPPETIARSPARGLKGWLDLQLFKQEINFAAAKHDISLSSYTAGAGFLKETFSNIRLKNKK